jgi:hypothetical protein
LHRLDAALALARVLSSINEVDGTFDDLDKGKISRRSDLRA